jgi:hypothetical protein
MRRLETVEMRFLERSQDAEWQIINVTRITGNDKYKYNNKDRNND